ncbi:MAG: GyrI-like domain-containing protein [Candidatus Kapabacteria bacterium]|nr:GyrI-like domain-containing protein [Candidatus Kapabacteria bacterium]
MITPLEIATTEEQVTASIHLVVPMHEMPEHMDPAIQELYGILASQGVEPTGPLFSYHHRIPTDTFDFEICVPISSVFQETGRVKVSMLPACRVVRSVYHGPYEGLGLGWREFKTAVDEGGYSVSSTFWERYVIGPAETQDPQLFQTELNCVLI